MALSGSIVINIFITVCYGQKISTNILLFNTQNSRSPKIRCQTFILDCRPSKLFSHETLLSEHTGNYINLNGTHLLTPKDVLKASSAKVVVTPANNIKVLLSNPCSIQSDMPVSFKWKNMYNILDIFPLFLGNKEKVRGIIIAFPLHIFLNLVGKWREEGGLREGENQKERERERSDRSGALPYCPSMLRRQGFAGPRT